MKEQRFEKVVEWEESEFLYRPYIIFFFLTLVSNIIFPLILIKKVPEWNDSFFPIGFILIFWIFSVFFSALAMWKRKVYWRVIK